MTFPPATGKSSAIDFELDSITREEFLGQIARSVRHIARHIPMETESLEGLGHHTKDGLRYTGDGILMNPHFMQELCKRQEEAISEKQPTKPLDTLFSALRDSLWNSWQPLDRLERMPLRGRDYAMLAEARLRNAHDSIHPLGFNLDGLSHQFGTSSAVPELLMVASNRVMEEIAPRLKDWEHYPIEWQSFKGMDFSANAPGMDMLREGIQAIVQLPSAVRAPDVLPKDTRRTIRELCRKAREINPQFDLTQDEMLNRLERITYNLSPRQLATLQLEQDLQPQFWDNHVTSIARPPFNAATPEDAVALLTRLADTTVVDATSVYEVSHAEGRSGFKVLVEPHRSSVLSLVNQSHLIDTLTIEQLAAVLNNEKIVAELLETYGKEKEIVPPHQAMNRIFDTWKTLGIFTVDAEDHWHHHSGDEHRWATYAGRLPQMHEYLLEIMEVMAAGCAALGEAFEGCPVTPPNPSAVTEDARDYYRVTLGKNQSIGAGLVEKLQQADGMLPQWAGQIKYPESGEHLSRDILIHKDMVHHVKFADFVKEPGVAKAIGAAATSHAASITKATGALGL
ncbi:MAG: hypothetical protein IT567_06970 [Alphaproteobacteria bacterium]|nr:hypothetical protein [Alphaproteobacteria bacterium]